MSKKPTLNQLAPDFEAKPVFGKRLVLQKEAQTRPLVLVFVRGSVPSGSKSPGFSPVAGCRF